MQSCTPILKYVARYAGPALLALAIAPRLAAEPMPAQLAGTWRITRLLPTRSVSCWDEAQLKRLLGTTLTYGHASLRWRDGTVPLQDIVTRSITAEQFLAEGSASSGHVVDFAQVGIRSKSVLEVDLQHDDADITGCSTEVPGDSVLLAAPRRIVFAVGGAFFEAVRSTRR